VESSAFAPPRKQESVANSSAAVMESTSRFDASWPSRSQILVFCVHQIKIWMIRQGDVEDGVHICTKIW
jgi:hypothetical protein